MSARVTPRDLMVEPRRVNDTSAPDSLPMAGAPVNAMSPHAPAPAIPEGTLHAAHVLAPAMKARRDAQAKLGLLHGRVIHDQAD
jgi:hypothetical protein